MEGGVYFFTLALADRQTGLLTRHIDLLYNSMKKTREKQTYNVLATVILPDHLHTIWKLPDGDANYASRWRTIKSSFTQGLLKQGYSLQKKHGRYKIWQDRFWEHTIRNDQDLEAHINYIHYNPVKHGLVASVYQWPYSSFHWYVRKGKLEQDWGKTVTIIPMSFDD
ncbi:Transposase IS200 like protein [Legionella spiritensis]|uniref:Transposase IS200 like protein n=1 Tax=Legionella spiritensis TaxID=452 RepID=A0A0W0YXB7_LEGSP|nr:transposase [Legionella spiritensis]KTD61506.1 Transposase IS200 like protein [Legionella spiritensis]SNV32984.1 Transposase and inactivated derivatives [Legionella spiritensis]